MEITGKSAAMSKWELVEGVNVQTVPHIKIVVAPISAEIVGIAGSISFIGAAAITDGMSPGILRSKRQPSRIAMIDGQLHGIVRVGPAARLVIDFRETITILADG